MAKVFLFNPYTGTPRHPSDIASDPEGLAIVDDTVPLRAALAATPKPAREDGMPASADERHLRRLLAARVGMPHTYFDDGEAQGAQHGISIDFMREPVADIDAKLRALDVARYEVAKAATPAPEPRGWVCQKCGVDRCKEACPKGHTAALTGDCPMVGIGASTKESNQ